MGVRWGTTIYFFSMKYTFTFLLSLPFFFPPSFFLSLLPHFFPSFLFFPSSFLSSCLSIFCIFCTKSCHFFLTPFWKFVAGEGEGASYSLFFSMINTFTFLLSPFFLSFLFHHFDIRNKIQQKRFCRLPLTPPHPKNYKFTKGARKKWQLFWHKIQRMGKYEERKEGRREK